jgi:hypothetical protein
MSFGESTSAFAEKLVTTDPVGCTYYETGSRRSYRRPIAGRCRRLTISCGQLCKFVGKMSRALERPYEELRGDLPRRAVLNVDETGHKRKVGSTGPGASAQGCTHCSRSTRPAVLTSWSRF